MNIPALEDYVIVKVLSEDVTEISGCFIVKKPGSAILRTATLYDVDAMDSDFISQIINQIYVMGSLKHPNIVNLYDCYIHEETRAMVIVTEYCDKNTLATVIENARYDEKQRDVELLRDNIRSFILQIAYAIKEMSEYEIIHRAISKNCLCLTSLGYIKLADFSVARLLDEQRPAPIKDVRYCCPEVFNKQPFSLKSDLWSLGIVIYQMLYLETPFDQYEDDEDIIEKVKNADIEYPEETALEGDFEDVILLTKSLLRKDPDKRISIESVIMNPMFNSPKICLPFSYANMMRAWDWSPKDLLPPYEDQSMPIDIEYFNKKAAEWRALRVQHVLRGRDDMHDSQHSQLIKSIYIKAGDIANREQAGKAEKDAPILTNRGPMASHKYRQVIIPKKIEKIKGLWNDQFTEEILHYKRINYKTLVTSKARPVRHNFSMSVDKAEFDRKERGRSILLSTSRLGHNSRSEDPRKSQNPNKKDFKWAMDPDRAKDLEKSYDEPEKSRLVGGRPMTYAEKSRARTQEKKNQNDISVAGKLALPNKNFNDVEDSRMDISTRNIPKKYEKDGKKLILVDIKNFAESKCTDINEYRMKKLEKRQMQIKRSNIEASSIKESPQKESKLKNGNGRVYDLDTSELPPLNKRR